MFPKYVLLSICAFIRVHFGRPGKFSQHSPFRCIHIFQKLVMISEFFFKEKLEVISFQKHVGFSARQLIFLFSLFFFFFFFICLFLFLVCFFFFSFFFMRYFAIYMHIQGILLPKHTYICFVRYFCCIHAYPRYLAT